MYEKIKRIFVEEIGIKEDEITLESDMVHDLGIESMDLYCILEEIEDEFHIKISDASNINTVGDIVDVVTSLCKN